MVLIALLACVLSGTMTVAAQEDRPEIAPGERKVPRKKDADPRAIAVLQLTANGKASLVPIAILVNGKFWDATVYKADPVPMALEPGTIYEAERAGSSQGLFTVNTALHSNAVNVMSPWIGTGKWVPAGSEPAKPDLKAETVPVGIDTSDEPPRLTKDPTKVTQPATPKPAAGAPASQSGGSSTSDDGPPRLKKPAESTPPVDSTQPSSTPTASTPAGQTQPAAGTDSKSGDAKSATPVSDSGASESNRPRLRRGKPAESFADEDVPGYSKPGAAVSATDAGKAIDAATAKGPVQSVPAISDTAGPAPRSFAFEWLKGEEGDRHKQMTALAKDTLLVYLAAQAKAKIGPKPTPPSARRTLAIKAPEPIFENAQMTAYDLWATNQPVIIFSAEAHLPPPPAGTAHSETESELQYSILIVAYPDMYNNLHKLYAGVTDRYHLDLTPRLELIDAVDADGDRRGELLFRETSDNGTGFVIYRATADKLWKMFDSLHPE